MANKSKENITNVMIINHNATINNWNQTELMQNADLIIMGSFNPFNPNGENADFYYGRTTNYFWRAIAEIKNLNPNIFNNNIDNKLDIMRELRFCFLDIINTLEITSLNNEEEVLQSFVREKIYKEFSDDVLFRRRTKFQNTQILIQRHYNEDIFQILEQGRNRKIIHTMGNNRISQRFDTKPCEPQFGQNGFHGFINLIHNHPFVNFNPLSYSPSGRAVRTGGAEYWFNLKSWLAEQLGLG